MLSLLLLLFAVGTQTQRCLPKNVTSLSLECRLFDSYQRNFGCVPDADSGLQRGVVLPELGVDGLPVFNPEATNTHNCLTNAADFATWFNHTNPKQATLPYNPLCDCYGAEQFYPVNNPSLQARYHHFTCLSTLCFLYQEGQSLTLHSDASLWLFLDQRLVVDLGGIHDDVSMTLSLGGLGLEVGAVYQLHLFLSQTYKSAANFSLTGNVCLVACPSVNGALPTQRPTRRPTRNPTSQPTKAPTPPPTEMPTGEPTRFTRTPRNGHG
jgi:fibro-slime domain-containing protein